VVQAGRLIQSLAVRDGAKDAASLWPYITPSSFANVSSLGCVCSVVMTRSQSCVLDEYISHLE
jgi:hypothetical protein